MPKYNDLRKLLKQNNFEYEKNTKGSHERWVHKRSGLWTTLTKHSKDIGFIVYREVPKKIKQAKEWEKENEI